MLQLQQVNTTLEMWLLPPLAIGITWSLWNLIRPDSFVRLEKQ